MSACLDADTLLEFFALPEDSAARGEVEKHLDQCDNCRRFVASYARATEPSFWGELDTDEMKTLVAEGVECEDSLAKTLPVSKRGLDGLDAGQSVASRFILEAQLGEGGMGVVWAAMDRLSGHEVALKFLRGEALEHARRFFREAHVGTLLSHPNILPVRQLVPVEELSTFALVMDRLRGESLSEKLSRQRPLEIREAARTGLHVAHALRHAHGHSVVHRDLKPQNIFLARDAVGSEDQVIVLDFGLAKLLAGTDEAADSLTRSGALVGTPHYMAPEQLFGEKRVGTAADVWSLGAVLYETLSARRPIEGKSYGQIVRNALQDRILPVESFNGAVPPGLSKIVAQMLDLRVEARPTLVDVLHALDPLV